MVNLLYNILLMSISGTIMYLISLLFNGRKQYAFLRYSLLTSSSILMLVPIRAVLKLPKLINIEVPHDVFVSGGYAVSQADGTSKYISVIGMAALVWLLGTIISAARFFIKYKKSSKALKNITQQNTNEYELDVFNKMINKMRIRKSIELRTSRHLHSPMLFGIIKPMVIIPEKEFSERELKMIITHELVHYKHRDLQIAFITAIAKCIHWFNPAVYFADYAMITARELCCDETVLDIIDPISKREYGNLILSVIETGINSKLAYTTSMASSKVSIQKRLIKIIEYKAHSRLFRLACLMLVCSFSVSSLTALGFEKAVEIIPEEIKREIENPVSVTDTLSAVIGDRVTDDAEENPEIPTESPAEADEETTSIPDETEDVSEPEYISEDIIEEAESEVYEFTEEYTAIETEEPEISDLPEIPEYKTIDLTSSSYMFKPDFSASEAVRSDNFEVPAGVQLSIQKYTSPGSDLRLEIYDADTDEIVTGETDANIRSRISFMMNTDRIYYMIAYCTTGGCDGIYVSGRDMYR